MGATIFGRKISRNVRSMDVEISKFVPKTSANFKNQIHSNLTIVLGEKVVC